MKRQRGMVWWAYLAIIGGAIGALFTMYTVIDGRGYKRGEADALLKVFKAHKQAADDLARQRAAVTHAMLMSEKKALAAEQAADQYQTKWQEARNALRRKSTALAVCDARPAGAGPAAPGEPAANAVAAASDDRPGVGVRFTFGFVRLYDAAWTGQGGEPVFPPAAGYTTAAGADTPSPYGPDDILDIHGENARRCSEDRRELGALMGKIEAAARAWDEKNAP